MHEASAIQSYFQRRNFCKRTFSINKLTRFYWDWASSSSFCRCFHCLHFFRCAIRHVVSASCRYHGYNRKLSLFPMDLVRFVQKGCRLCGYTNGKLFDWTWTYWNWASCSCNFSVIFIIGSKTVSIVCISSVAQSDMLYQQVVADMATTANLLCFNCVHHIVKLSLSLRQWI